MTEHDAPAAPAQIDTNDDSTVDAICAIALILIAVAAMIYWVSNQ